VVQQNTVDVPLDIFLAQISNPDVRSALAKLSDISPSSLVLSLATALSKAQDVFNAQDDSVPNIITVSAREMGPVSITDGIAQAQIFYTIGGNIIFIPENATPLTA
jgi:hypothetical protein